MSECRRAGIDSLGVGAVVGAGAAGGVGLLTFSPMGLLDQLRVGAGGLSNLAGQRKLLRCQPPVVAVSLRLAMPQ